jgi:hypothetical protein
MLIGVTGDKRAGKDTVAKLLCEHYGYMRYALADPMRDALLALDPYVGHDAFNDVGVRLSEAFDTFGGWEGLKASQYALEVRRLQERFGTEAGRDVHGNGLWINALVKRMNGDGMYPYAADVVVPDVRFDNEADWVHDVGGVVIKVTRPGTTQTGHASSAGIHPTSVDYHIRNDGSVLDLKVKLHEVMLDLGIKAA